MTWSLLNYASVYNRITVVTFPQCPWCHGPSLLMGSGFSSVLHPGLGGWDERAFRPSRGNRAALSGFVMMSTRSPEGNPLTTLTTAPREEASGVCVFRGGVETPMFRL